MSRSPLQKRQLAEARSMRWEPNQKYQQPSCPINPRRYVLATLTEGLSETIARRFLVKLDITPPSKEVFYKD